jgi:uncharacterized protein DUF4145
MEDIGGEDFLTQAGAWRNLEGLPSRSFVCGYCDNKVATTHGYIKSLQRTTTPGGFIYICPHCTGPNAFDMGLNRTPESMLGSSVDHVPDELTALYQEARTCTGSGCHTAAVLCLRKMLMNIAVNKGADEGLNFIQYIEYLQTNGYIPPDGSDWVDHIRKKGNEATHEIADMNKSDSENLVVFVEMLLRYIYEFSGRLPRPSTT